MPTAEQIQQAIAEVHNQQSFIKNLLTDTLNWPINLGFNTDIEDITYEWTDEELRVEGLSRDVLAGPVLQMQSLEQKREQPWGIFILEFSNPDAFTTGRGLTGPLRKVLRGLCRRKSNLPAWDRENLLFICTYNYQYFCFAYFKTPKETKTAPLITFGWGPDTPARTACEFNLPALEWPQDPDNVEAWQEQWQRAFDKEKLTKDFFKTFANLYHQVVDDIAEVRELKGEAGKLAQLLLDRMLFLYFIQRKGWLDQKLDYLYSRFLKCWNKDPDGHSYYSSVLYPLFLSLSNTNFSAPEIGSVPFLNGGLFEESTRQSQAEQIAHARLKVKNSSFKLIFDELLERFNFTVTEDTPLDVEVAIDPEMLGKIFESLILQLEKEPGKDLRKLTGSYYTPRPIVHFMCQEALKEYLVAQLAAEDNVKITEVEDLLKLPQADQMDHEQIETLKGLFAPAEAKILHQAILDCRICDPAVGSGAFPVGMLHEMVAAIARLDLSVHGRDILNQHNYYYDLKKQIIESCLYGVDIQEQAVRLCELRLWLSLVVDYQIDPTKSFDQAIREVPSLPNLSYRIMRGDSLLERLFGHVIQLDIMAKDAKSKQIIDSIQADKQAYFREGNNEEKRRLELKILAKQADLAERLIAAKEAATTGYQTNIFGDEGMTAKDRKAKAEVEQRLIKLAELKKKVAGAKSQLERLSRQKGTINRGDLDTLRRQYFHTGESPTFIWHVDFAEVFKEKEGFNMVIANPPYIEHKKLKGVSKLLKGKYLTYAGTADLYVYFFEKGLELLKDNGVLTFISSNKFMRTRYGANLRGMLATYNIHQIVDFTKVHVFDALVASCVLTVTKESKESPVIASFADDSIKDLVDLTDFVNSNHLKINADSLDENIWQLEDPARIELKSKIEANLKRLDDFKDTNIFRGITTGCNDAFVIDGETKKRLIAEEPQSRNIIKPLLQGRNIRKWTYNKSEDLLLFVPWHFPLHNEQRISGASKKAESEFTKRFPAVYKHLLRYKKQLTNRNKSETGKRYEWYALQRCAASYYPEFEKEKIVWGLTADKWAFAYDENKYYLPSNGYILTSSDLNIKYLLAILNSSLMQFYFSFVGIMTAGGAFTLKHETIGELPIKEISNEQQQRFVLKVDKIFSSTKDDGYLDNPAKQAKVKELENQIDELVYKLYSLTDEEIAIVKGNIKAN